MVLTLSCSICVSAPTTVASLPASTHRCNDPADPRPERSLVESPGHCLPALDTALCPSPLTQSALTRNRRRARSRLYPLQVHHAVQTRSSLTIRAPQSSMNPSASREPQAPASSPRRPIRDRRSRAPLLGQIFAHHLPFHQLESLVRPQQRNGEQGANLRRHESTAQRPGCRLP